MAHFYSGASSFLEWPRTRPNRAPPSPLPFVAVSSSQLIVHSSRVLTPKRHHSESVLYLHDNDPVSPSSPTESSSSKVIAEEASVVQQPPQSLRIQHRHSPSYPPVHTSMALHHFQQQDHLSSTQSSLESPTEKPRSHLGQSHSMGDLQQQQQQHQQLGRSSGQQHKSSISVTISSSEAVVTIAPQLPAGKPSKLQIGGKSEVLSSSTPNMGGDSHSHSPTNSTDSYRSNHRLFPVSTYTEPVHSNTSQYVQHPKPQFSSGLHKSAK